MWMLNLNWWGTRHPKLAATLSIASSARPFKVLVWFLLCCRRCLCSLVVDLFCHGCHSVLGMIYASTPKSMDQKRFTFCLNVADIDRYLWTLCALFLWQKLVWALCSWIVNIKLKISLSKCWLFNITLRLKPHALEVLKVRVFCALGILKPAVCCCVDCSWMLDISWTVSYVLGSAKQMVSAGGAAEQPVTLEYRGVVEQQLTEVIYCCRVSLSLLSGRETSCDPL